MGRLQSAVARANTKASIPLAAAMLAASTIISSGLGFVRITLLTSYYYETYPVASDAFSIAFAIPDFMYVILVSGALSVTCIPVFNQRLGAGNKESAWKLSTSLINFMALITLVTSILIIIFADPLVRYVVGPGLDESGRSLAISMMRVVAVNPFLFAVSTVIASMQQAIGRFTFYALAPTIYNIGIIIGILFFTDGISLFGRQIFDGGIMGVALGVILGAILQLIVSSIGLMGVGFDYQFKIFWKNKGFRRVLSLLPPRSLDQGADYLILLMEMNLASRMAAGTVWAYQVASTLHMVPISFIGVAISTAAFPSMTAKLGQGRKDLFQQELRAMLRVIIWLALPVALITFFTRGYLVSFIDYTGDAKMAGLLGILALAILFRSIYHIAARSFYAQQDTRTPLYISLFAIGLNILLAVWFALGLGMEAHGLALAQSLVAAIEVGVLFVVMERRAPGLFDNVFVHAIARMASATGLMSVITYACVRMLPLTSGDQSFYVNFPKLAVIAGVSFIAYIAISRLFGLEEANPIIRRAKSLLFS